MKRACHCSGLRAAPPPHNLGGAAPLQRPLVPSCSPLSSVYGPYSAAERAGWESADRGTTSAHCSPCERGLVKRIGAWCCVAVTAAAEVQLRCCHLAQVVISRWRRKHSCPSPDPDSSDREDGAESAADPSRPGSRDLWSRPRTGSTGLDSDEG